MGETQGNPGAIALSEALCQNTVLTSLDLRSNDIHLKGIGALGDMLRANTTLRHMDIGSNFSKNQGALVWANVLMNNSTLTRLCLTDNQIYDEGGNAIARALNVNRALRNFSYGGQGATANRIDANVRRIIDQQVMQNKRSYEAQVKASGGIIPTSTCQAVDQKVEQLRHFMLTRMGDCGCG